MLKLFKKSLIIIVVLSSFMSSLWLVGCTPLQINVPVACPILRANFTAAPKEAEKNKDKESKPDKKSFFRK